MNRGRLIFLGIFSAIFVVLFLYVGLRFADEAWHWVLLFAILATGLALPFYRLTRGPASKIKAFFEQLTYVSLGMISSLVGLALLRDAVLLVMWAVFGAETFQKWQESTRGTIGFVFAGLMTLIGVVWAKRGLRIRHVKVPIRDLPPALEGFRIAQISDLHIGATIGRSYVQKVVRLVRSLDPDVTVLTGDIIDGPPDQVGPAVDLLGELPPKDQVFYVPGNHEYYWDLDRHLKAIEKLGIHVLLNRGRKLQHKDSSVWVGGVTDPAGQMRGPEHAPQVPKAFEGGEDLDFKLLLSHRPHLVEEAARVGFHLQLSGHTHGGQFFPWTYVVRFAHRYFLGLMQFENTWIYVNPGTGSWGPPLRLGTTPEVTHLTLTKA